MLGHVVHPHVAAVVVVDCWYICSLGSQGSHYQGVCGHVEEEGGEGDGLDCQLPAREAIHEKGNGGSGAYRHSGELNIWLKIVI